MLGLHGTKLVDYSVQQGSSNESRPPEELYKFRPCKAHGRFAHGRLIEITDSYTLLSEDQPGELASAIRQFVRGTPELAKMRSIAWGA